MNRTLSQASELPMDTVGEVVDLLVQSGVGEITVRQGDLEITVKAKSQAVPQPSAEVVQVAQAPPAEQEPEPEREDLHAVRSPIVGTLYRAPAPGEEPYVEVGDQVSVGQTLCIIEAMKLMNEIPADISGEIVEVLAQNAQGVQYDQPLFLIRPG